MNEAMIAERVDFFCAAFVRATEKIERIDAVGDRINEAIKLIWPLAVFDASENRPKTLPTLWNFTESVYERIASLGQTGERDYLLRLLLTEVFPLGIFSEEKIERLVASLNDSEEALSAIYVRAKALLQAERFDEALEWAERLDEQVPYEKIVRKIILASLGTDRPVESEIFDRVESPAGRVRLFAECSGDRLRRGEASSAESYWGKMLNELSAVADRSEKDELLAFVLGLAPTDVQTAESLLTLFSDQSAAVCAWSEYCKKRFSDERPGLSCRKETERASAFRRMETLADAWSSAEQPPSDERAAEVQLAIASVRYLAENRVKARSAVRDLLTSAARMGNAAQKAIVYQSLGTLLTRFDEVNPAEKVTAILQRATDQIEPEDLRQLVWRENILLFLRSGRIDAAERLMSKIVPPHRTVFETALRLARGERFSASQCVSALEPLDTAADDEEAAAGLVKICRLLAVPNA